jgi:NRPS condensation-like uncharacterized protein
VKSKCKELGVTVNDMIMTVVSMTIKQYFLSQGDEKTKEILIMIPYNFRQPPPKDKSYFDFSNNFVIFPVTLRLFTDFSVGVKAIN